MLSACTTILVGVASIVSEILNSEISYIYAHSFTV